MVNPAHHAPYSPRASRGETSPRGHAAAARTGSRATHVGLAAPPSAALPYVRPPDASPARTMAGRLHVLPGPTRRCERSRRGAPGQLSRRAPPAAAAVCAAALLSDVNGSPTKTNGASSPLTRGRDPARKHPTTVRPSLSRTGSTSLPLLPLTCRPAESVDPLVSFGSGDAPPREPIPLPLASLLAACLR